MTDQMHWTQQSQPIVSGTIADRLGLPHRIYIPNNDSTLKYPTLIMVHGLHGNEDAPWVFARAASRNWLIISPRAPLATGSDAENSQHQFSWARMPPGLPADPVSFANGLHALTHFIAEAGAVYPIDPARMVLLGFSQGAAMSYAYTALRYSTRAFVDPPLIGLAALAGFIPAPIVQLPDLNGLPTLILHGTQDETVAVSMAQQARDRMAEAGAIVTYEESPIGHKVSAAGMRTLAAWFAERLPV